MRRLILVVLFSSLAFVIMLRCSEKCPLEPCRPREGVVCGVVEIPQGFSISFRDLRVRTLVGSADLDCNSTFAVPVLTESGAHIVVVATEDTVPVLLGCSLLDSGEGGMRASSGAAGAYDLERVIGSPEEHVRVSAASTALALTMVNPLMSGASEEERLWFANQVVAHRDFDALVAEIGDGLRSSPTTYLNGESFRDLFLMASHIVTDIAASIQCGGACDTFGLAPYVEDASGDAIALKNAAFVHYGVGIADALTDTLRAVLLLPRRKVCNFVQVPGTMSLEYDLGDACVDISFFKGIVGVDEDIMFEIGNPAGMATQANLSQAIWNVLAVFDAFPPPENPHEIEIGDVAAVEGFAEVIRNGDPADLSLTALHCALRYPDDVVRGFLGAQVETSDLIGFLASVCRVFEKNTTGLVAGGLEEMDRFALDLIASPDFTSQCICQTGGEIFECPEAPLLSAGGVEPDSGDLVTEFTFLVHYCDDLRDPPSFVRVGIDSVEYDMEFLDGEPYDGVYRYAASLSPGMHRHYFRCVDTTGAGARFPDYGRAEGPFVASPPVLSDGRVQPAVGSNVTNFKFTVDCYDPDGQVPVSVRVFIDGDPRDMEYVYSGGNHHRYRLVTMLPGGEHDHFFQAVDPSGYEVRLPADGVYEGPSVSEYIPELSNPSVNPSSGDWGQVYTYEVDYLDRGGDPPYFIRVCCDGTSRSMHLKTGEPSDGTYSCGVVHTTSGWHKYYFECADSAFEQLVRLPETGKYDGPFVGDRPGGESNYYAKIAVHVMAYDPSMDCDDGLPAIRDCRDIQTTYEGANVLAFPVFYDLAEYRGVEFGLSWPEWEGSVVWQSCSDLSIGEITHPGDGVSQVWYDCHLENVVVPGWIWVYADGPGLIEPCVHPVTGRVKVLNCWDQTDDLQWGFRAGVNGAVGDDPCW